MGLLTTKITQAQTLANRNKRAVALVENELGGIDFRMADKSGIDPVLVLHPEALPRQELDDSFAEQLESISGGTAEGLKAAYALGRLSAEWEHKGKLDPLLEELHERREAEAITIMTAAKAAERGEGWYWIGYKGQTKMAHYRKTPAGGMSGFYPSSVSNNVFMTECITWAMPITEPVVMTVSPRLPGRATYHLQQCGRAEREGGAE